MAGNMSPDEVAQLSSAVATAVARVISGVTRQLEGTAAQQPQTSSQARLQDVSRSVGCSNSSIRYNTCSVTLRHCMLLPMIQICSFKATIFLKKGQKQDTKGGTI